MRELLPYVAATCAVAGMTLAGLDFLRLPLGQRWRDGFTAGVLTAAVVFFASTLILEVIM